MRKKRKRFNSKSSAENFAKKVDGVVNDNRHLKDAKSAFSVTYYSDGEYYYTDPIEEDYGHPKEYWRD